MSAENGGRVPRRAAIAVLGGLVLGGGAVVVARSLLEQDAAVGPTRFGLSATTARWSVLPSGSARRLTVTGLTVTADPAPPESRVLVLTGESEPVVDEPGATLSVRQRAPLVATGWSGAVPYTLVLDAPAAFALTADVPRMLTWQLAGGIAQDGRLVEAFLLDVHAELRAPEDPSIAGVVGAVAAPARQGRLATPGGAGA